MEANDVKHQYEIKLRLLKAMMNEYKVLPSDFLLRKIELCNSQLQTMHFALTDQELELKQTTEVNQ